MNSKLEKLLDEGIVKEVIELNKYSINIKKVIFIGMGIGISIIKY